MKTVSKDKLRALWLTHDMTDQMKRDIADLLDATHDVLLERGRCRGEFQHPDDGSVCMHAAVNVAAVIHCGAKSQMWMAWGENDSVWGNTARLLYRLGYSITWNDDECTTDDMVFDALRNTAKMLRDGEL